jgi:hypothetical protein
MIVIFLPPPSLYPSIYVAMRSKGVSFQASRAIAVKDIYRDFQKYTLLLPQFIYAQSGQEFGTVLLPTTA